MKKIMSRILIIFILVIILFEFVYSSNISYALEMNSETINSITNLIGGLVSIILWIPRLLVTGAAWKCGEIMTKQFAEACDISDAAVFSGTKGKLATPFDIFFNKYNLFDVNFFDISSGSMIDDIRMAVAEWFYTLRLISAAVLLCVLIYVGIMMAITSVADDKAKYKKMLIDWACSLALIFVLQYIAIFTIYANNAIVNFLREVEYVDISTSIDSILEQAQKGMGIGSLVSTFVYCMIIFQTIAFMITYLQRMLKVGFLIIISPMISITYSIDKISDGKAQALNSWLKEFVYTILIQPFHCIMYLAFVNPAIKIVNTAPTIKDGFWAAFASLADGKFNQLANGFLVILCLKFINDGEKAIRKIFNFQDDGNMTSMAAGAAVGMAALSNAKKIGSATAKGINTARSLPTKLGKAIGKDSKAGGAFGKISGEIGKAFQAIPGVGDKVKDINEFAKKTSKAISGSKVVSSSTNAIKLFGGKVAGYKAKADELKKNAGKWLDGHPSLKKGLKGAKTLGQGYLKRSIPLALGMMGAAMSYATGTSGALEAIGVGSGFSKGSSEFFESTQENLEGTGVDYSKDAVNDAIENDEECQKLQGELDENTPKLKEAKQNLKKANAGIRELSEYQKVNADKVYDIEERRAELEKQKKQGDITDADYKEKIKQLDAEKDQLINGSDKEEGIGRKAYHLLAMKYNSERIIENQGEILSRLNEAKTKVASQALEDLQNNGQPEKVAKAKSDIQNLLLQLQMQSKKKSSEQDSDTTNELDDDDVENAGRMQKSLCALIDRSLMGADVGFDTQKYIQQTFGSDRSPMAQDMERAINAYMYYRSGELYNDTKSNATSVGVDKDKFDSDCIRKITGVKG